MFIGALSVLSILNLVLLYAFAENQYIENVLLAINAIMTPIFLGDFFYRFFTAESKSRYFWRGFGWADLLSSLPLARAKVLRLFRLWRVIRLLMEFGARNLVRQFVAHRAENALLTVVFLVICVLEFGSLAMLRAELGAPDANIQDASDAIWWAYVTITTVGYGDRFPTTNAGRIVGIFVMTAGVGLFGTLSGFLANKFLTPPAAEETPPAGAADDPKARIGELRRMIAAQEQATAEFKRQLEAIEELL
jgi:voltage-gated potassium channel